MLYIVVSPSCLSQMEVPYLLNCSPDFFGEQPHDKWWATYTLNDSEVDGELGEFGTVRVHDDYWHIDDTDRPYYNFEVRNSLELTHQQYLGLLNLIPRHKNIAVLLHAQNIQDIFAWSRTDDVMVIAAYMGDWENDIEYWAMREFNTIMQDDRNANYTSADHTYTDIASVVTAFNHRRNSDRDWRKRALGNCDRVISQPEWQRSEEIFWFWDHFGVTPESRTWCKQYFETFQSKQEYNVERLQQLRKEYNRVSPR